MPALEQSTRIIRERNLSENYRKLKLKLPTLQIQKFSGDPKQYYAFRDAFGLVANEINDLTYVDKFTYLRSYLTGVALRLQARIALTIRNYRVTLEL